MARRSAIIASLMLLGAACASLHVSHAAENKDVELSPEEKAWVNRHPLIRIQMSDVSPPFEFKEKDRWKGLAYEMLLIAARRTGLEIAVTGMGWSESLENIQGKRDVDLLLCVSNSPEREKQVLLTEAYLSFPQVIFTTKQHPFISGLSDLHHSTIVVEKEYLMEGWLKRDLPDARLIVVQDSVQALQVVSSGQADAYVGNLGVASYLIDTKGLLNVEVAAPSGYGSEAFSMGVRKDWPELVSILNKGLASIAPEEQQALRQKWIAMRYEYGLSSGDIVKWVLIVAAVALIFIVQLRRMVNDRTRALKQEIALRRAKELHLSEAQRIAHLGSWSRDLVTNELAWSDETRRLFGWPDGKAVTFEAFMACIHPEDREGMRKKQADALEGREPADFEYRIRHADGQTRHLLERCVHVRDASDKVVKLDGIVMDITERKRMEEHLMQSQKVESIGRLAGGVAHDFNNLLTSILGFSELARFHAKDNPGAVQNLQRITEAANRGATLTQQLLAYARKKIVHPEAIDLNKSIERMLPLLQRLIGEDIELALKLEASPAMVLVDPGGMEQVVINLAVNARDAMPGGGKLTIATSNLDTRKAMEGAVEETLGGSAESSGEGPQVILTVRDTGSGIAPGTIKRIFEPFFTTKPVGKGTGLGLAMCLGIVNQAGGMIEVSSEPGKGATFRIQLPRTERQPTAMQKALAVAPRGGSETILVVEDDALVRELACASLRSYGYDVIAARDGVDALQVAGEAGRKIHLLVTDVVMPRMGGQELAAQIKTRCADIKVLFASGYTEQAIVNHGVLEKGAILLQKPYTPSSLATAIRSTLDRNGSSESVG